MPNPAEDEDEAARVRVPLLQDTDDHPEPLNSTLVTGNNPRRVSFAPLLGIYHGAKATALQFRTIKVLLVFVPLGLAAGVFNWTSILVSTFNFFAIIPLSAAVSDFSDTLSDEFGDLLGALINATFGNAVELIVGILAVVHGDTALAQSVMLGSILSDILFVLGSCFFFAARSNPLRKLNTTVTGALSSLMIITAVALILPTALYSTLESSQPSEVNDQILAFSRGTAIVLLGLYCVYLYFELGSHKYLFEPEPERSTAHDNGGNHVDTEQDTRHGTEQNTPQDTNQNTEQGLQWGTGQDTEQDTQQDEQQDVQQTSHISGSLIPFTGLICSAIGIGFCSHFLLDNIKATSAATGISITFIATILIPVASNAPECATVVGNVVGISESSKVDFAVGVIVSSILQIALFVIPVLVMLGWAVHESMDLNFETFQTIILFLAIVLVNQLLQNGKYTYMHGLMLMGLYAVIAVAFFLRHDI